jgi:RNA polymerase sigma factor (sigma-70 family)
MARAEGTSLLGQLRRLLCASALTGAPDEALLGQFVTHRDQGAFAVLVRRHGPMVWGICRRILGDSPDAEDAFQATFLIFARKAAAIQRRELLANWLFGVARRSALRVRAVQARHARREQSRDPLPEMASAGQVWSDARAVLDEELARLPAKYRMPLLLCGLEGLTHAEAAKSLGWPTGTVAGRLSRGRALLRTRLLRRGITGPAAAVTALLAPLALPRRLTAAVCEAGAAGELAVLSPAVAVLVRQALRTMALSRDVLTSALVVLVMALAGGAALWPLSPSAEIPAPDTADTAGGLPPPVATAHSGRAARATPLQPALRLPADPNAVVVRMERRVASSSRPAMTLTITADGRVTAQVPDGLLSAAPTELTGHSQSQGAEAPRPTVLRGNLRGRDLEDLLRFVLHEQEFFDIEPAALNAGIWERYQSDGIVSDSTDSTTTTYRIRTADRSHELSWTRLGKSAWDFPDMKRLFQLYAMDRRLQQVVYVLVAGGPERVEAAAAKMNELAQPSYRLYPTAPRLTAADLFCVKRSRHGSGTQFTFSRIKAGTVRSPLFEIAIEVPQDGEPSVDYVIPPQG